jgi:hypothetical protein
MYISVKDLIKEFKEPFDSVTKATKKAKKVLKDREEKITKENLQEEVNLILAEWDKKTKIGETIHSKINQLELEKNSNSILEGYNGGTQSGDALDKKLCLLENNKIYLEKLLFSNKYKILGYADKISVSRGTINIIDIKVVEKIYYTSGYKLPNGIKIKGETMGKPLQNLDSCNYNDYCLQLSLYMYLAWENNKSLKIGRLYIRHIIANDSGKKISDELIEVPYMKKEIKEILKYQLLNEN